jgi:hypothetical protein
LVLGVIVVLRRCLDRSRYGKEYGKRRFLKSGETEYPNRSRRRR